MMCAASRIKADIETERDADDFTRSRTKTINTFRNGIRISEVVSPSGSRHSRRTKNSSSPGYPQLLYIDGEPIAGGKTRLVALLNLWWSKRAVTRTFQLAVITATVLINMVATAVRAREGDFILDNLYQDIRPVSQAPYKWVRAQQEKNPRFWSTVSPARTEEIVMNVR